MLKLEEITQGFPGMTKTRCRDLLEACIVCLSRHKHSNDGTPLLLRNDTEKTILLVWTTIFDDQMDRTWNDQEEATEYGAACIGILIALEDLGYEVFERSVKGTGFDYWLGRKGDLLLQKIARLEVSGIFLGADKVDARFRAKIKQVEQSNITEHPAYICVVEFGTPSARFGEMK
jgi:hypothetical protein